LIFVLTLAAHLRQLRREGQAAREQADAAIALSLEHGIPHWLSQATVTQGWALAEQGAVREGIAQLRQGAAGQRATGAEALQPWFLAMLAEAYGKAEQAEEGLTVLAEALAVVDKNGERFYEAELYRLKGELLLAQEGKNQKAKGKSEDVSEAEECFQKAIDIARKQEAKSWELRAATSLARLWQQQGKKAEARQMLAEIYSWFTEGFDTKDLQEAKALLEQLRD
jgi:adenylate cyclase